jgi:hypothetical protein
MLNIVEFVVNKMDVEILNLEIMSFDFNRLT